jgi:hypothetical protein
MNFSSVASGQARNDGTWRREDFLTGNTRKNAAFQVFNTGTNLSGLQIRFDFSA